MPDMINSIIEHSILRKAIKGDLVKFDLVDLRDFGLGNYKQIDDPPYGGGGCSFLVGVWYNGVSHGWYVMVVVCRFAIGSS